MHTCSLFVPVRAVFTTAANMTEGDPDSTGKKVVCERVEMPFKADPIGTIHMHDKGVGSRTRRQEGCNPYWCIIIAASDNTADICSPSGDRRQLTMSARIDRLWLVNR